MVILGNGLGDGQAEAEASVIAAAGVGTVKSLKEMGQLLRRDGLAAVFHRQHGLTVPGTQFQTDEAAVRGVFDAVVQQEADQLGQLCGIAGDGEPFGDAVVQLPPGLGK